MSDPYGTPPRTPAPLATPVESCRDDDGDLLETLLLFDFGDGSSSSDSRRDGDVGQGGENLYSRLNAMHTRLTNDWNNIRWWDELMNRTRGFQVHVDASGGASVGGSIGGSVGGSVGAGNFGGGSTNNFGGGSSNNFGGSIGGSATATDVPPAFQTPSGKRHLQSLMDACDIDQGRAVQLTLGTLAALLVEDGVDGSGAGSPVGSGSNLDSSSSGGSVSDGNGGSNPEEERTALLHSHLGTPRLFHKCVMKYRASFLERTRILLECLRLDQEGRAVRSDNDNSNNNNGDNNNDGRGSGGGNGNNNEGGAGGGSRASKEITKFLDEIDSKIIINGKKRGLFQLLLGLALAPLPEVFGDSGGGYSSYSNSSYNNSNNFSSSGNGFSNSGYISSVYSSSSYGHETIPLTIRKEAVESLLVLLYDRLDGGVFRLDLFLLLEGALLAQRGGASSHVSGSVGGSVGAGGISIGGGGSYGGGSAGCLGLEFAMSSDQYKTLYKSTTSQTAGTIKNFPNSREALQLSLQQLRFSLNALWGLLCAECMGLWRTNADNWREGHPLLVGLSLGGTGRAIAGGANNVVGGNAGVDTPQLGLTGRNLGLVVRESTSQPIAELKLIYEKFMTLGDILGGRRRAAYKSYRRAAAGGDDELYGIQAPEAVCLLSFGLLLQLASSADNEDEVLSKLNEWGQECTHLANDNAAFSYLHRVLEECVVDPLMGVRDGVARRFGGGVGREIVSVLAGRREISVLAESDAIEADLTTPRDEEEELVSGFTVDASSVVYSSIGREILSATIRVFRPSLLSASSSSAENIGMLVDLAALIYRHSPPLCDQFWSDWEELNSAMKDEGISSSSDEAVCFLLDTAHSLVTSSLVELAAGAKQEAIVKFLRPMSSYLCFISSLCPSSSAVQCVISSIFLPEGLIAKTISLCFALAPLANSLNESVEPVTSEERGTMKHATLAMESIGTIAYLGGLPAREWIRESLGSNGRPRVLFTIASNALPRRNGSVSEECSELASASLNLLAELLVESSVDFYMETAECFLGSNTFANSEQSAFSYFFSGGIQNPVTLSALTILCSLAVAMEKNAFDSHIDSRLICAYIETVHAGVRSGLEVLTSIYSSGEVLGLTSQIQVDVAYAVMLSTVALLLGVRPLMYLHPDENVRVTASTVRDDIVSILSSSTALGQVIAYLSTVPITLSQTSFLRELTRSSTESTMVNSKATSDSSKYGAWSRFVTPKRASQKSQEQEAEKDGSSEKGMGALGGESSSLSVVSEIALSLLLTWGNHVEDMFRGSSTDSLNENFISCSPYNLLLSKAPSPSSGPQPNLSNLNIISRFMNIENEYNLSVLSAKVIKMCLQHASTAQCIDGDQVTQSGLVAAFGGGITTLRKVILHSLNQVFNRDSFSDNMEQNSVLAITNLETIILGVRHHPELARCLLSGEKGRQDFKVVDELVNSVDSAVTGLNVMNRNGSFDSRVLRLRCVVARSCLEVLFELWNSCRLGGILRTDYHGFGGVVGHLVSDDGRIASLGVELAKACLVAIVSQEDKNSMLDEVPIHSIREKSILLSLLSKLLSLLTIETVARMQTNPEERFSFIDSLINPKLMEHWIFLLSSNKAPTLAASAWVECKCAKNIEAFLQACPPEAHHNPCSLDLAIHHAKTSSHKSQDNNVKALSDWNDLYNLAMTDTFFATEWAQFFQTINLVSSQPDEETLTLTSSLLDCVLTALSSISESKLSSQSVLFPDVVRSEGLKPFEELSSLLLSSLTKFRKIEKMSGESLLQMLNHLYESSSRIFTLTQPSSMKNVNEACSIRQNLLASALIMLNGYQNLPKEDHTNNEIVHYSEVRLGWLDITLNAIQSLQFSELDPAETVMNETSMTESQFIYNFVCEAKSNKNPAEGHLAFELLRTSCALMSALAPAAGDIETESESLTLSYTYSGDFVTCMRRRNALIHIENHLAKASTVASLTYRAVFNGTVTPEMNIIHKNAITIIEKISNFLSTLADSSSVMVDILFLLTEARCLRSFSENPLLKLCSSMWVGPDQDSMDQRITNVPELRRGYVPAPSGHQRKSYQDDSVHSVWCAIIEIFSSMLRSVRRQSMVYAHVDHKIHQQLVPTAITALDFLCSFEDTIFSCFSSMHLKPKGTAAFVDKKSLKGIHPNSSSTIPSSSFSFTSNMLKEASYIVYLLEQLCTGDMKNKFMLSYQGLYKKMHPVMLEMMKNLSSFLGSIGNARDLFSALSSASTLSFDQHASMFDAHPLLADGIPNARHESIRNSHFASSCCTVVTAEEYALSHSPTRGVSEVKPGEGEQSKNLEQTFQIQVNNKFIDDLEKFAGSSLFSVLSILTYTHPASDSFVSFSSDEISRLDVASIMHPGTLVAITKNSDILGHYCSSQSKEVEYGLCKACDRSTRTIIVEFANDTGTDQRQVPWSWISGMEDISRRQSILSHHPSAKSVVDFDPKEPASIGNLILTLRWCHHITNDRSIFPLAMRVADRASILLSSEVVLHDELNKSGTADEERKINAQLLDLFECTENNESTNSNRDNIPKVVVDEGILKSIRVQLRQRLEAASSERQEEQKIWEQQNSGWDTRFWGGSHKREGRRSPFRGFKRMSSKDSSQ